MPRRPFIALADPLWIGHRETYFREFVLSLHRVGADVAALCPFPERLEEFISKQSSSMIEEDRPALLTQTLTEPSRLPLLSKLPHDPITTLRRWRRTTDAIRQIEQRANRKVDFLFLPWLDSYLRASLKDSFVLKDIDCPWAGLYFRPYHLLTESSLPKFQSMAKGDSLLQTPSCSAVAVLDETLQPTLSAATGKPVVLFPDITDESAPDVSQPFAIRIREAAKGRKVIGLIGLERRKGVTTLLKTADIAREAGEPWLFVLAGAIRLEEYTAEEQSFISDHINRSREGDASHNVLFADELKPVPDGPAYNGVMATFDILYTAYHDFQGSSNVLTKASVLHKPVISTKSGCIGHRTEEYQLGITIPQADAQACCNAIGKILGDSDLDGSKPKPRYAEYYAMHSRSRLDSAMTELISMLPAALDMVRETATHLL